MEDFPGEQQSKFVDIPKEEGGGFVGKEAIAWAKSGDKTGEEITGKDVLHEMATSLSMAVTDIMKEVSPIFAPPLLKKEKVKILFCGRRSDGGADGAESYHRAWGVKLKFKATTERGTWKRSIALRLSFKMSSRKGQYFCTK